MRPFFLRWHQFVRERFSLLSHLPMILLFYFGNLLTFQKGSCIEGESFLWRIIVAGPLLILLIFFHMRIFDEIKDYQFDGEFNPERPLPRGLISVTEANWASAVIIALETTIAILSGLEVAVSYLMVLGFTLLMRFEFFAGSWLRPRRELYAITHTFSAFFLGLLIFSLATGMPFTSITPVFAWFCLGNWFMFNLFEFARKTYGTDEEPSSGDSYSARLGGWGSFLLILFNIIPAWILTVRTLNLQTGSLWWVIFLLAVMIPAVSGGRYALTPRKKQGEAFRNWAGAYLLIHYGMIIVINIS